MPLEISLRDAFTTYSESHANTILENLSPAQNFRVRKASEHDDIARALGDTTAVKSATIDEHKHFRGICGTHKAVARYTIVNWMNVVECC